MRSVLIAATLLATACTPKQPEVPVPAAAAARAFNKYLTWEEVRAIVPDAASDEDSALLAERYINDWMKEQAILHTAEQRLPESQKQFEDELEAHRKALLTYAYENLFVQQRLDTLITEEEINRFYEENQSIFALNDYIVKVKFVVLPEQTPKLKQFKKLFESDDPENLVRLEQFCVDNGAVYYIDTEVWMYFEELLARVPLDVYNVEAFLRQNRELDFSEDGKLYFVKFLDFKLKDAVSPLPLVEGSIRSMILNRRKKDLLAKMRDEVFLDAYGRKDVEKLY